MCVKEIDKRDFVTEKQGLNGIIPIRIRVIKVYIKVLLKATFYINDANIDKQS